MRWLDGIIDSMVMSFDKKFIAIVNPNPKYKPCAYTNFMDDADNPFTYFQRLFLWNEIVIDYNKDREEDKKVVSMFPCWHAQQTVALENEFLVPREDRAWIVPFKPGADTSNDMQATKAWALKRCGERVYRAPIEKEEDIFCIEESNSETRAVRLDALHASRIRASLDRDGDMDKQYQYCVPGCIADTQKRFYLNIKSNDDAFSGLNIKFITLPFIGDTLEMESLQYAINEYKQRREKGENVYLVFSITVKVENAQDWWFKNAVHDESSMYYFREKADAIHRLMQAQGVDHYLTAPYFIQDNNFNTLADYNKAFLPPQNKNVWILNSRKESYYAYRLRAYLRNQSVTTKNIDAWEISEDLTAFFEKEENAIFVHKQEVSRESLQRRIKTEGTQLLTKIQERIKVYQDVLGLTDSERRIYEKKRNTLEQIAMDWEDFLESLPDLMATTSITAVAARFDEMKQAILNRMEHL